MNPRLTRPPLWSLIYFLALLVSPFARHAQERPNRGGEVRVRYPDGQTRNVSLYKNSYALLIGNSDYTNWNDLPGIKQDMNEVRSVLKKHGFNIVSFDSKGETIFDQPLLNLTRQDFTRQMEKFVNVFGQDENNRLLIYYAGHGYTALLRDERKMGYLVMRDAPSMPTVAEVLKRPLSAEELILFRPTSVTMDEIETFAKNITSLHALFVFDSCFAGTILFRDAGSKPPPHIDAEVLRPVREFLTAGNELQPVPDDSYFRKAFVRGLDGAADAADSDNPKDGYILASELYAYIRKEVARYSQKQTPIFGKILKPELAHGDFVFIVDSGAVISLRDRTVSAPRTETKGAEVEFWEMIRDSPDPSEFDRFLEAYPKGVYAATAKFKRDKIRAALEFAKYKLPKQGMSLTRTIGNGVTMEFVGIPPGEFMMGPPPPRRIKSVEPEQSRKVTIKNGFWMGKYEVSQKQWQVLMPSPPSLSDKCDDCPITPVSWLEVQQFIQKLNEKNDGFEYRLPSEAEWEYAARANSKTRYYWGDSPNLICYYANVHDQSLSRAIEYLSPGDAFPCDDHYPNLAPVGKFEPNGFGLHDMIGNVEEWCEDVYSREYKDAPVDGSANVQSSNSNERVVRGGSFTSDNNDGLGSASRRRAPATSSFSFDVGFRLVVTPRTQ